MRENNLMLLFIVRSPYLATSTPYPNKKHQDLVNGSAFGLHQEYDDAHCKPATKFSAKEGLARVVKATGTLEISLNEIRLNVLFFIQEGLLW